MRISLEVLDCDAEIARAKKQQIGASGRDR